MTKLERCVSFQIKLFGLEREKIGKRLPEFFLKKLKLMQ